MRLRRGFTLVEILVVVAITGLITAVAMPNFLRAMRGAGLRTASRTVVMACKYARSMAVLDQKERAVLFDRVEGSIEVIGLKNEGAMDREGFLDARAVPAPAGESSTNAVAEKYTIEQNIIKHLPRGVKILGFESERSDQVFKDIYWVSFYPSGMNDGFRLRLEDEHGKQVDIEVDRISGSVKVGGRP